uniref:Butyrophilin-like protein 2 n=1 Tax=Cyprinodon variegatus TaxID=28743 RepID=A0A3Q2CGH5_CYPVA
MELIPVILLFFCSDLALDINDPDLVCPSEPVGAVKSQDVILPCHLEPPMDASAETVKWKQGKNVVHLYRGGKNHPTEQYERYRGRTSLFTEGLTEGNLSLTLSSVNLNDDGTYQCSLQTESLNKMCYINLNVEPYLVCPTNHIDVTAGDNVVLPCYLDPPVDASTKTILWKFRNKILLHYKSGEYTFVEDEEQIYLFNEGLTTGNLSLKLFSVDLHDNGEYKCYFITKHVKRSCSFIVTVGVADETEIIGSEEPVSAEVGNHVILPCHVEPPISLTDQTVEWSFNNSNVHVYRSKKDDPGPQDERYRNRTSLFHEELIHGNMSLKLINVTKEDAGNYTCIIPKMAGKGHMGMVTLKVVSKDMCFCPVPHNKDKDNELSHCCSHEVCIALGVLLLVLQLVCIGVPVIIFCVGAKTKCGRAEHVEANENHLENFPTNHDDES